MAMTTRPASPGGGDGDGLVDPLEREPVGHQRGEVEAPRRRQPRQRRDVQVQGSPRPGWSPGSCARTASRRRPGTTPARRSRVGRSASWCRRRERTRMPARRPRGRRSPRRRGRLRRARARGSAGPDRRAAGSIVCEAPSASASARLAGSGSTAITGWADTSRAPCTAERPTPPQAKIATASPGRTLARLVTDSTPVVTPHPSRQARSAGTASAMGMAALAGHTACVAKLDTNAR